MTNNDGITQPRSADSLTHSARPVTDHLVEVVGEDEYGRPFTAVCYAESETHKALLQPRRAGALAATIAGGVVAFLFGYALVSHLVVGTMSTVAAIVGATFLSFFGALGGRTLIELGPSSTERSEKLRAVLNSGDLLSTQRSPVEVWTLTKRVTEAARRSGLNRHSLQDAWRALLALQSELERSEELVSRNTETYSESETRGVRVLIADAEQQVASTRTRIDEILNEMERSMPQQRTINTGSAVSGAVYQAGRDLVVNPPARAYERSTSTPSTAGESHQAAPVMPPTPRPVLVSRVDQIKADYGEKLSDTAYLIENYALFDRRHEPTAAFEDALIALADLDLAQLAIDELEPLVDRLTMSWADAVANAEQLGYDALDDPSTGRRAAKIADKAARTTGAEQEALEAKLAVLMGLLGVVVPDTRRALSRGERA